MAKMMCVVFDEQNSRDVLVVGCRPIVGVIIDTSKKGGSAASPFTASRTLCESAASSIGAFVTEM